jgi:hypothetical protein
VYVDNNNVTEGDPKDEYIGRMNVAIDEVVKDWGMPQWYVDGVLRNYIPEEDEEDVGMQYA